MDKTTLIAHREEFFNEIIKHMNTPPSRVDKVLNQEKYYIKPNPDDVIINSEYGDMIIKITGKFYDKDFEIFYSLWQVSDSLKIGIALSDDELQGAFTADTHNEVYYIWGWKSDPKVDIARGCVFYDWEFDVPTLYESYKVQERFILGVKHMHFRTMRIIHDECERIYFARNNVLKSSDDIDNIEQFDFKKLLNK